MGTWESKIYGAFQVEKDGSKQSSCNSFHVTYETIVDKMQFSGGVVHISNEIPIKRL